MFPVPVEQICIPILHLKLGLGLRFYNLLESKYVDLDREAMGLTDDEDVKHLYSTWRSTSDETFHLETLSKESNILISKRDNCIKHGVL